MMKEYKIVYRLPNNIASEVLPGKIISEAEYLKLGAFQDRCKLINSGEVSDEPVVPEYKDDPEEPQQEPAVEAEETETNEGTESVETENLEDLEVEELKELFSQKFQQNAPSNIKKETLISKIKES